MTVQLQWVILAVLLGGWLFAVLVADKGDKVSTAVALPLALPFMVGAAIIMLNEKYLHIHVLGRLPRWNEEEARAKRLLLARRVISTHRFAVVLLTMPPKDEPVEEKHYADPADLFSRDG